MFITGWGKGWHIVSYRWGKVNSICYWWGEGVAHSFLLVGGRGGT